MCVIWTRPSGTAAITDAHLRESMSRNPDGYGFAAFVNGALVTEKFAPGDRAKFIARYREVEATGATIIGHARIATHGPKDAQNAHPFMVTPEDGSAPYALVHNGILSIHTEPGASDTETYCKQVLARLPGAWWDNPALFYLVQSDLGYANKFAILTADGEVILVNERAGCTEGAMWFSNTSYKPYVTATTWTPAKQTAASNPKPSGTPPTPGSKRQQKRAARAAANAARRAGKTTTTGKGQHGLKQVSTALITLAPADPRSVDAYAEVITHAGHNVTLTGDLPGTEDTDLYGGVGCDICGTLGDVFRIDGRLYFDLNHFTAAPTPSIAKVADALPF